MNLNKVMLIGRLGRDPELKTLESGAIVGNFSLATTENYKDKSGEWQEKTEWADCVMWNQLAERAAKTLGKGALVYVEGKLQTRSWEAEDGTTRRRTEVVINTFRKLEKSQDSDYNPAEQSPLEKARPTEKQIAEDDMPF